jgi:hypothetical protein
VLPPACLPACLPRARILIADWTLPYLARCDQQLRLPRRMGACSLASTVIFLGCVGLGVTFFICRHEPWSWALQDCLCLRCGAAEWVRGRLFSL